MKQSGSTQRCCYGNQRDGDAGASRSCVPTLERGNEGAYECLSAPLRFAATRVFLLVIVLCACPAAATEYVLNDGRVLRGSGGLVDTLTDTAPQMDDSTALQRILFVDDQLRRTFLSKRLVARDGVRMEANPTVLEKFNIRQRVAGGGQSVHSVGPAMKLTPFDEFGRRTFTMNTNRGPVEVIQGITQLTPQYAKVEGLSAGNASYVWDMRIATSSIPREVLDKILFKLIDPKKSEDYKRIARFYMQAERYEDAIKVLDKMAAAFPDQADLKEQLKGVATSIRQLSAEQKLAELKLRRDAGQHVFVCSLLEKFPTEDVGGDILQGVREMIQDYKVKIKRREKILAKMDDLIPQVGDAVLQKQVKAVRKEIGDELRTETLDRFASFLQNLDDAELSADDKLALAVSGWIIGSDNAIAKLPPALSLYKVREHVKEYMNNTTKTGRDEAFDGFRSEEVRRAGQRDRNPFARQAVFRSAGAGGGRQAGVLQARNARHDQGGENHVLGATAAGVRSVQALPGGRCAVRRGRHGPA